MNEADATGILRSHPNYVRLVALAAESHARGRDPSAATSRDVALSRLYSHAFRRHVIGAFHATRRDLAGVEGEVFHNAIDTAAFTAAPVDAGGTAGTGARNRLVYVGRIVPGKGWDLALATAEQLAADHPEMELHIVGDGIDRTALASRAAASPLAERVVIHGQQPPARIAELLQGSVFLNPTTLSEGFQTTLLEAVAAGAAVVSTPVGAARYLLEAGADVRLADAADPGAWVENVRAALDSPAAPPAKALVDSFDWKRRAAEYLAVINSVRNS